ncbi:uncharacterized protein cubi_01301 [Cryptosporidium ubiquitum]|uniref:Uncharacterized protein n=1 Tax=Cryptosporidium ubiquitum TaxID=857276 RepID=A0A1J4MCI9_9CRYT|nr:uncharacterized protein cubi_01301 [Cryptosporidium ubiquitum]OII71687.1 hypothetical protein cubi_01301 [Cryptosporidium ubiquitum]
MQNQRNYAKQELIYDLLFGNHQRRSPKGGVGNLGDSDECLICKRDKLVVAENLGVELSDNIVELLCIECKRGLFSFEGFRYQCKQVKNSVSNLESISVVLNEQMRKLSYLIRKEKNLVGNSTKIEQNKVPDWCNRDIPSKFGKGNIKFQEGIEQIKKDITHDEESRLSDQLQIFHGDLLNLQETIFTFINVLEAYIDTPWISVLKEARSKQETQPCVTNFQEDKNINPVDSVKIEVSDDQNKEINTTAQRIERIRKQQEKVRQQIKALYDNDNTDLPDINGSNYFNSIDKETNKNKIGNYFLFTQDTLQSDEDLIKEDHKNVNVKEANIPNQLMLRNYDILWSPSSASASSDNDSS